MLRKSGLLWNIPRSATTHNKKKFDLEWHEADVTVPEETHGSWMIFYYKDTVGVVVVYGKKWKGQAGNAKSNFGGKTKEAVKAIALGAPANPWNQAGNELTTVHLLGHFWCSLSPAEPNEKPEAREPPHSNTFKRSSQGSEQVEEGDVSIETNR